MSNVFSNFCCLSDRERALSQLVLQLAFHVDESDELARAVGFDGKQVNQLKETVAKYERSLADASPTLSSLLEKTVKSSCCT